MRNMQAIAAHGRAVAQHHFTGSCEGQAVALFEIEGNVNGTHFVSVFYPNGTVQDLQVMPQSVARNVYSALIEAIHDAQREAA